MDDLSRLADIAEIIGALIVVGGVVFAVLQMQQIRQQRREMAAIELFRSFGSPAFSDAYRRVLTLPDGLNAAEIRERCPECEDAAMLISTTMENIGVMVFHRIVPSVVVNDLIGTSTVILFNKLERWIDDLRKEMNSPGAFEWFQWLAEMLEALPDPEQAPAYESHRNWRPGSRNRQL
ncbi:MAG: hypothetical protein AAFX10_04615 [Pseudomonadota bacterium]